jgi:pimeloyl-ACP methyl ester carboxylesterase
MTTLVLIVIVILVCVFCAGLIAEALRIAPKTPEQLYWAPEIPIRYVDIDGNRIRYIRTGSGPNLVLLHTLRTQLDIFEKLVPLLEKSFTVYALDYPGHGFSDIPQTDYRPELFVKTVEGFLDKLDLSSVTLAGISIGGVIPLIIAAKKNKRVRKVIAINPYDYGRGSGLARANAVAGLIFTLARVPVLGESAQRGVGEPHLAGRRRRSQSPHAWVLRAHLRLGLAARSLSRLPQSHSPCPSLG